MFITENTNLIRRDRYFGFLLTNATFNRAVHLIALFISLAIAYVTPKLVPNMFITVFIITFIILTGYIRTTSILFEKSDWSVLNPKKQGKSMAKVTNNSKFTYFICHGWKIRTKVPPKSTVIITPIYKNGDVILINRKIKKR